MIIEIFLNYWFYYQFFKVFKNSHQFLIRW